MTDPEAWRRERPFRVAVIEQCTYDGTIYDAQEILEKIGHLCDYILFDEAWAGFMKFHPLFAGRFAMGLQPLGPDAPGIFATQSTHRGLSLVSTILLAAHVVTAVVDEYVDIRWWQAFVPFGGTYRPLYLGLGTLALDLVVAIGLTSLGGHPQMVRPLLAPMAEGAAEARHGPLPERVRHKLRAYCAATDNVGLFFGEDIFVAFGAIVLMMVAAFAGRSSSAFVSWAAVAVLIAATVALSGAPSNAGGVFGGLITADLFGSFGKAIIFLAAILLAATLFDRGSGILATLLSALAVSYVYMPPRFSLMIGDRAQLASLLLFGVIGVLLASVV